MGESDKAGKDTKQGETSAASSTQTTASTSTPRTFTPEEVQKQISDALTKAGRDAKAIETEKSNIAKEKAALEQWRSERAKAEQERQEAELNAALEEVPEDKREAKKANLKAVIEKTRNERQALESDLKAYRPILDALKELGINDADSLKSQIKSAKETAFEMTIFEIANKNNVSADVLMKKAAKLGITSEEGIEELAADMPKKTNIPQTDSGKGAGGAMGRKPSLEELRASSPFETDKKVKSGEWVL